MYQFLKHTNVIMLLESTFLSFILPYYEKYQEMIVNKLSTNMVTLKNRNDSEKY